MRLWELSADRDQPGLQRLFGGLLGEKAGDSRHDVVGMK
jgi:hypothetical protein